MKLLEKFVETCRKARRLGADFRRNATAAPAARKSTATGGSPFLSAENSFCKCAAIARVISRRARINFGRKFAAQFQGGVAAFGNLLCHLRVIRRVNHDRDAVVVFGRAAEHRRPADVNVLDRVVQAHVRLGDRLLERIKIHDHQINRRDAMFFDGGLVRFIAANEKQAAVDFRMQRLHAAIQHFGKAGVFADVLHGEAGVAQCFGRAAGGNDFNSCLRENLGERNKSGFVRNGNKGALNFHARKIPESRRYRNRQMAIHATNFFVRQGICRNFFWSRT